VPGAEQFAAFVKNRCTDWNAALDQAFAGLGYGYFQHGAVIGTRHRLRLIIRGDHETRTVSDFGKSMGMNLRESMMNEPKK
jgi:hypothetical protein